MHESSTGDSEYRYVVTVCTEFYIIIILLWYQLCTIFCAIYYICVCVEGFATLNFHQHDSGIICNLFDSKIPLKDS